MREGAAEVSERAIDICEIIKKLDYEKVSRSDRNYELRIIQLAHRSMGRK